MQAKMKYTWDAGADETLSEGQVKLVGQISDMMTSGFEVKSVKRKLDKLMTC
jgi:hypothetical protein